MHGRFPDFRFRDISLVSPLLDTLLWTNVLISC